MNHMKITAILSVYKEPKLAGDSVRKLLNCRYRNKEIVVIVDGGTNPKIEKALRPFKKKIRVVYNRERYGKSASLNRVVNKMRTDVLFFLDNDIRLPDDRNYLDVLAAEMKKHDITEIPKEAIQKSLISRMMGYEFLGFAMTSLTIVKISGHCPSMNGAAFATRKKLFDRLKGFRRIINEDMDFAARAFRLQAKFGYNPALKAENGVPVNLREWLTQRKRWALNNISWLRDNFLMILSHFFKSPSFFISTALLLLPTVSFLVVFILMKVLHSAAILPAIFMTAQQFNILAGFFLWFSHYNLIFTEGLVPTLIGLVLSGLIYYIFAKILRFRFNILEFILFYFVYSPIWLLANVIMWVLVIFKVDIKLDWKV